MKPFVLAVALTCVLSVSTLAGEMPTCGVLAPPLTPAATASGDMPTTGATTPGEIQGQGLLATIVLAIITWPRRQKQQ